MFTVIQHFIVQVEYKERDGRKDRKKWQRKKYVNSLMINMPIPCSIWSFLCIVDKDSLLNWNFMSCHVMSSFLLTELLLYVFHSLPEHHILRRYAVTDLLQINFTYTLQSFYLCLFLRCHMKTSKFYYWFHFHWYIIHGVINNEGLRHIMCYVLLYKMIILIAVFLFNSHHLEIHGLT